MISLFFSGITLFRDRNQSGINDLTTTGFEALISRMSLIHLKALFDYTGLA